VSVSHLEPFAISKRRKFSLSLAAGLIVLVATFSWVMFDPEDEGRGFGFLATSIFLLMAVFIELIFLFPLSIIFYLSVSHRVFQKLNVLGCISCMTLGSLLGFLGGGLRAFFDWSWQEEGALVFASTQGALFGLSFWILHAMNLFKEERR
jgi:hypothetical protein